MNFFVPHSCFSDGRAGERVRRRTLERVFRARKRHRVLNIDIEVLLPHPQDPFDRIVLSSGDRGRAATLRISRKHVENPGRIERFDKWSEDSDQFLRRRGRALLRG